MVRLLLGYCVYRMHSVIENNCKKNEVQYESFLYYMYMTGLIIYIVFSFAGTLSQRMTMPLKSIEVLLIPIQLSQISILRNNNIQINMLKIRFSSVVIMIIPLIIVAVMNVELIKNINSYIVQGNYYEWVNPINYPYVSVFNKDIIFDYISQFKY